MYMYIYMALAMRCVRVRLQWLASLLAELVVIMHSAIELRDRENFDLKCIVYIWMSLQTHSLIAWSWNRPASGIDDDRRIMFIMNSNSNFRVEKDCNDQRECARGCPIWESCLYCTIYIHIIILIYIHIQYGVFDMAILPSFVCAEEHYRRTLSQLVCLWECLTVANKYTTMILVMMMILMPLPVALWLVIALCFRYCLAYYRQQRDQRGLLALLQMSFW